MQLCDDHITFNVGTFLWKESRVVLLRVLDLSQELQFVLETSACPCVTLLCANLPFMVELNPRMWNVPLPKTEFLPVGLCWKWRKKIKRGPRRPNWMKHVLSCGFCFVILGMPKSLWACFKVTLLSVQVDIVQVGLRTLSGFQHLFTEITGVWHLLLHFTQQHSPTFLRAATTVDYIRNDHQITSWRSAVQTWTAPPSTLTRRQSSKICFFKTNKQTNKT